ncbi:DNA glycosylase [Auriculariales sp. MPI-PUGE-AT-0066]|nr:DNA glycosylase [Auriculariales sp. MPI-PUGE-AT-0066]
MEWLNDYFQLDVDLQTLYSDWAKRDTVFDKLVKDRFKGLRMLRQDPWENLVSFICSQNNHISRISKMVQALCTNFGHCAGTLEVPGASEATSQDYFAFPPPSALAAPSTTAKLRALGFGYRAEYIQKTAQMLLEDAMSGYTPCEVGAWSSEDARSKADATAQKILHDLRGKNTEEAREALLRFMGVGRKVADCILLMSLDKREVVPVDTHVYQIAVKHYSYRVPGSPSKGTNGKVPMTPKIYDAVASKFVELWGNWAGWAHSVLFTADLKSFATYGLVSPSPSPAISPTKERATNPLDDVTPSPSPSKRKRSVRDSRNDEGATNALENEMNSESDLATRVKNRKRLRSSSSLRPTE